MTAVVENSADSLGVDGGQAGSGVPNDGTGELCGTELVSVSSSKLTHDPGVVQLDPWLSPFRETLKKRYAKAQEWFQKINETEGGMEKFTRVSPPWSQAAPFPTRLGADAIGFHRVPRSLVCIWTRTTMLSIGSGLPMPPRHS